jgi:hypothetical protein
MLLTTTVGGVEGGVKHKVGAGDEMRTEAMYEVFAENKNKTWIHVLFNSLDIVATNDKIICK